MVKILTEKFKPHSQILDTYISNFKSAGKYLGTPARNTIKIFPLGENEITIKAFKIPNIINQITYRFFRKSKAERSYTYAKKLRHLGIGTPEPIAYYEFTTVLFFKKSYYVSAFQEADITFRTLTRNLNYPNHEQIIRAFTRFTFTLHENNVNFLDHSPGNTLIKINEDTYNFYLVDLNRMRFEKMNFTQRIKNFAKLTKHRSIVAIMSDEYAKISGAEYTKVFHLMWQETQAFQEKYHRKKRLKKKLKFWKKNN